MCPAMETGRQGPLRIMGFPVGTTLVDMETFAGQDGLPGCGISLVGLLTQSRSQLAVRVMGYVSVTHQEEAV